ncbi:pseudouridylate synthase TRUB1 isoform X1 [Ovis aries]|uniref:pseudouridylate synthase TRUB1 isoform X1 n=1 Tax=Ovis aries TaxID=9940 RepID=UPI001C2EB8CE|nr:pseudouridylate synthase TRUB1 isoform X1 [Ovis aries]
MAAAEAAAVVLSCLKPDPAPVPESAGTAAATAATSSAMAAAAAVAAAARTGSEARVSKPALATKLLSLSGVFAVHKPKGPTSAELLNRLKEKLLAEAGMPSPEWTKRKKQTLKIGHGGTLDSAARGVLVYLQYFKSTRFTVPSSQEALLQVVGIGRGTKMLTSMLSGSKRYIAIGELGKATDTLDSTGKVTEEKPYDKITQEDIESILQKFTGNIMQVPPLIILSRFLNLSLFLLPSSLSVSLLYFASYSALKKDGQRLSALMKRGEEVEAKPARPVTVYSLSLQKFQPPFFTLDVECGGGFYIRSLVSDIGKELSSCANVLELTRTKQGPFTLEEHALPEDKWTIDDIAQSLERCSSLFPAELALKKSKPEESNEQVLSCEYITLNETKGEDDVIKTL